jgi:outer membrane scaffolding protein for murein synthesis (MipA/OmpV family)
MRLATTLLILAASGASAQDGAVALSFEGGLGAQSAPAYFGSDETGVGVTGSFALNRLRLGNFEIGGDPDALGFGLTGSFRYIADRKAEDYAELTGMADVDAALELGGGFTYRFPDVEIFATARRGFGGYDGYVGEIGGDLIVPVTDQLTFRAGPRLLAGDAAYAETYFGVTAADAANSAFSAYDPTGGVVSRGLEVSADYDFTPDWGVTGTVRYDEFVNDAAESPIVRGGSSDSVTASIVITRDISFDF